VQIVELWRYPVKSLQGERLDAVAVTADGLEGDRQFAIYDLDSGLGLTGRRVPELLFASARMRGHRVKGLHHVPLDERLRELESHGFRVEAIPMSKGTPFANVLLVARYDPKAP